MGCVKLHIVNRQYKNTELKESNQKKELTFAFCVGEARRDIGLYYFGARYYAPWLCRWINPDPLQHKLPNISSFAYCNNNPVNLVDPTGMSATKPDDPPKGFDAAGGKGTQENPIPLESVEIQTQALTGGWFVNELTGDIYFDDGVGADGADLVSDGKNWKWLGENNMFGTSANDIINQNINTIETYAKNDDGSVARAAFRGEDAKAFMESMGYKQVPTQVIEYTKSNIQRELTPGGMISVDLGCTTQITEKVGYVPKDFKAIGRTQIGDGVYSNASGSVESVTRQSLSYGKPNLSKIGKIMNAIFGGTHDYKNYGPCIPNQNMINQFKNR